MPWSGSAGVQTFQRTTGVYTGATCWGQTDAASRGIRSDDHDYHDQDIADGISACLNRNGGNALSANIPMAGFKLTGLAAGTAAGDSVRFEQLESGVLTTRGDMLYRGAAGTTRLPKGTLNQALLMGPNDPQWGTLGTAAAYNIGNVGSTVPLCNGDITWGNGHHFTIASTFDGANAFTGNNTFYGSNTFSATQSSNTGAANLHGWLFLRPETLNTSAIWINNTGGGTVANLLQLQFCRNGGVIGQIDCDVAGGAGDTEYMNFSDDRFKSAVRSLDDSGEIIDQLAPIRYRLGSDDGPEKIGFSAQDLHKAVPQAAKPGSGNPGDEGFVPWMRAMGALEPVIVAELKFLRARVAALEANAAT